jgi:pantoate--beta-alanine ligase
MRIISTTAQWIKLRKTLKAQGRTIGLVPTMGALHEGHASLVRRSAKENDVTIVSVFVNPTQFNDKKDLAKYPRTPQKDAKLLSAAGADYMLMPEYDSLYPDDYRYRVSENKESAILCGAYRPGHFDGVLTVVLKLLCLAGADRAYFGEKDYQQYRLIAGMKEAFFLPVEIVPCKIVRESDGLAMSSRNALLTPENRKIAPQLNAALTGGKTAAQAKAKLAKAGFKVDYVQDIYGRRFAAAKLGSVRLIDNVKI